MSLQHATWQLDPWASTSLYEPIRLGRFGSRGNCSTAAEGSWIKRAERGQSGDKGDLASLLKSRAHRNAGTIRDTLLWSTSLTLAFRLLSKTEAHLFELGLEAWALRLTRLRAGVTEAFLLLSLQSNSSTSCVSGTGSVHPAVSLLEASFNIQVFRGAVACRFLDEAHKLQPFFSPSALRGWVAALSPATEAGEGFSTAMGRQACCFSVVTLHRTCCLISIGELLITLGEQCLLIGELGVSSLLGSAASLYLPSPQVLKECNPNIYARQIAMLATSRFRQGDVDGSLQLLDTVTNWPNAPQLELPVGLDVAEALWVSGVWPTGGLCKASKCMMNEQSTSWPPALDKLHSVPTSLMIFPVVDAFRYAKPRSLLLRRKYMLPKELCQRLFLY